MYPDFTPLEVKLEIFLTNAHPFPEKTNFLCTNSVAYLKAECKKEMKKLLYSISVLMVK